MALAKFRIFPFNPMRQVLLQAPKPTQVLALKHFWSNTEVPLPAGGVLHYNPDVRAGTESWHDKKSEPGSGNKTYNWPNYNEYIWAPDGTYRPAFVVHMRSNVKYSPDKMWYCASFVRGMSVDEALKQLKFQRLKGCRVIEQVIEEAREMAMRDHHFEYATNMWVAESFCNQSQILKGARRHARMRFGTVKYRYTNYYVRLEEGKPPQHYYEHKAPKNAHQWLEDYVKEHRAKNIYRW